MIKDLHILEQDSRSRNLARKKRHCLMCGRLFTTTAVTRVCGKCHKLTDKI